MPTTTTDFELAKRLARKPKTMAQFLASHLYELADNLGAVDHGDRWPRGEYRDDPVKFAQEVLGLTLWKKQIEILNAVRDNMRVAVRSGHKVSKSHTAAILALWFYCSFDDARVVMTSVTARQVDEILWREVRMMHSRAKNKLDGEPSLLARTGLKGGFREIVGFTAREAEAVAGISGKNLIYILDEASGIDEPIFEAIEGNRAGGARLVMFSNPTRCDGTFFEAFHASKDFYKTIAVSSEEAAKIDPPIPGLATLEYIQEKEREWGRDSPLFKVRVLGEFVYREEGRVISVATVTDAEERWAGMSNDDGPLCLGIDPAGPGRGDETAIAVRRGRKILRLLTWAHLKPQDIIAHVRGLIKEYGQRREEATVCIDSLGPVGSEVFNLLRIAANESKGSFRVFGVRASDKASRRPDLYDRKRDELWANMREWLHSGAIPEDTKLARELTAPNWEPLITGKLKVSSKDQMRNSLGRSPDRADALCLAVWNPMPAGVRSLRTSRDAGAFDDEPARTIDPYDGESAFR